MSTPIDTFSMQFMEARFFDSLISVLMYGNSQAFRATMQARIDDLQRKGVAHEDGSAEVYQALIGMMAKMDDITSEGR